MKVCLFGATGLLGSEFKKIFKTKNLDFMAPTRGEVQLLDFNNTLKFLKKESPDLIINCAAFTDVDGAEKNQEACFDLNVDALRNITKSGIPLINFSTEYVFSAPCFSPLVEREAGEKSDFLEIPENYPRNPQGAYAKSKAQGEKVLEKSDITWWNIRTTWLFGSGGKNFVDTILKLSKAHKSLKIVNDQFGRPTYAPDLAKFVVENFINKSQKPGHYHLQNTGKVVSWAEFAEYFLLICHPELVSGSLPKIIPVTTKEYGAAAPRPKNSVLRNTKLKEGLRNWKKAVKEFLEI